MYPCFIAGNIKFLISNINPHSTHFNLLRPSLKLQTTNSIQFTLSTSPTQPKSQKLHTKPGHKHKLHISRGAITTKRKGWKHTHQNENFISASWKGIENNDIVTINALNKARKLWSWRNALNVKRNFEREEKNEISQKE